jgi:hypothetical protein
MNEQREGGAQLGDIIKFSKMIFKLAFFGKIEKKIV